MARVLLLVVVLVFISCGLGLCADRPVIPAVQVSEPPKLDGVLDDECWKLAPSVTDFYYESVGSKAPEPTTAWICYDQKNIYVAFYCKDSQPDKIKAEQTKRGGDIYTDDRVGFSLDCANNQSEMSGVCVSAGGGRTEFLPSGDVSKIEWRGDWDAKTRVVSDGFIVEMAVPWGILRYDPKSTCMGLYFSRTHARLNQGWGSPNTGPQGDIRLVYLWDGLKLPVPTPRPIVMAYGLFSAGDGSYPSTAGIDAKYWLSPCLVANAAINPDFRNVEQQVASVDFTYTELQLDDNRPFFQEGSAYLSGSDMFYSRRIDEIDYGLKLTGSVGAVDLGVLHGSSPDDKQFDVIRLGYNSGFMSETSVNFVRSAWPGDTDFSWLFTTNQILRQRGNHIIDSRLTYSAAENSVDGTGVGHRLYWRVTGAGGPGSLVWDFRHETIDKDYRPRIAYIPEWDFVSNKINLSVSDSPASGRIGYRKTTLDIYYVSHLDGSLYRKHISSNHSVQFRSGTGYSVGAEVRERPPFHERFARGNYWWGQKTMYEQGFIYFIGGSQAGGDYFGAYCQQGFRLGPRMSAQIMAEYSRIRPPSPYAYEAHQYIAGLSYDINDEQNISGRAVVVGDNSNFYLCYRRRGRAGTDAYLILGDPNAAETKNLVALKLVKAF